MRQCQPDTGSAEAAGAGPIDLAKEFKNHLVMFRSDPYSGISHCNGEFFLIASESSAHTHLSDFCELCRIGEQVAKDKAEFWRIGPNRKQLWTNLPYESNRLTTQQKTHHLFHLFAELGHMNLLEGHRTCLRLNLGEVQEILYEAAQQACLFMDTQYFPAGVLCKRFAGILKKQLTVANDDMQGSPQFMRNIGEQLLLQLLHFSHFVELRSHLQGHIHPS